MLVLFLSSNIPFRYTDRTITLEVTFIPECDFAGRRANSGRKRRTMHLAADKDLADVLVVDDTPTDRELLAAILSGHGYRVRSAASGVTALEQIERAQPDLILLDIHMPEMNGFEVCRHLKQSKQFNGIPVIFVSVSDDTDSKVAAFNCGGIDYVTKPFRSAEIQARIHAHLQMKYARDQLGFQAGHDTLTGLPNRNLLTDRLQQAISFADRYGGQLGVAYIDLDKFKTVNDRLGHEAGDHLLVEAACRLQSCVRESDTIARIGGDEFVIVFYDQICENVAAHAMQRILDCMAEPIVYEGYSIVPSCSIGFAFYPQDGGDVETLLKNADIAMYRAKELGRNNSQFFTGELNQRMNERMALERSLRLAIEREEFVLHYQPRIDLRGGQVIGLEALIRWQHPELGLLPPLHFIPLAEEAGLIGQIGDWVIRTACAQHKQWQQQALLQVPIAINISPSQFLNPGFAQSIASTLRDMDVAACHLEFDFKESLLMQDPAAAMRILQELKVLGIGLSIDDFGTGFSNLGYLKRFPVDRIKLDPSFISEIQSHPDDLAIADAVIAMAHSLRLKVAAEGMESGSQLALLAAHGCDEMQGDYFSPALPADLCLAVLLEKRVLEIEKISRSRHLPAMLLVSRNENSRRALSAASQFARYRLLEASDAREAFDLLAAEEVGIVLCDQGMSGIGGVEFLSRVKQMYPNTVRILLGGEFDATVSADAINRGGIYKFLHQPWSERAMADMLADAFARYEGSVRAAGLH